MCPKGGRALNLIDIGVQKASEIPHQRIVCNVCAKNNKGKRQQMPPSAYPIAEKTFDHL